MMFFLDVFWNFSLRCLVEVVIQAHVPLFQWFVNIYIFAQLHLFLSHTAEGKLFWLMEVSGYFPGNITIRSLLELPAFVLEELKLRLMSALEVRVHFVYDSVSVTF